MSKEFTKMLKDIVTIHHLTVHDLPQSNGAAKRSHRTHIKRARSMLISSGLGLNLWAEAVNHSVWISSRLPSRASTKFISPIEKATGKKPNLSGVLEWGKPIWVKDLHAQKLDPRAKEGKFVGYDDKSKGY